MQKLLQNTLFATGLSVLGIVFSTAASYAGTATLNLSRTVGIDCTFSSPNYSNASGIVNLSGSYASSIVWEGTVGVTCNHGGNVQISSSSPGVNSAVTSARSLPTYQGEYLSINGTNIWKNGLYTANPSVTLVPSPSISYKAEIVTDPGTSGPGLANGNYSYSFTLTATPN